MDTRYPFKLICEHIVIPGYPYKALLFIFMQYAKVEIEK